MNSTFKKLIIDLDENKCLLDEIDLNNEPLTYMKLEFIDRHFELTLEYGLLGTKKELVRVPIVG